MYQLKQIGVALHSYHSTHRSFPPVYSTTGNFGANTTKHGSALIMLLPYLEQQALYDMIDYWRDNGMRATTAAPINWDTCPGQGCWVGSNASPPAGCGCHHHLSWQAATGFKSQHPGGAHFLMADGSVHFLDENIDYVNYRRLGDRRDGESVSLQP